MHDRAPGGFAGRPPDGWGGRRGARSCPSAEVGEHGAGVHGVRSRHHPAHIHAGDFPEQLVDIHRRIDQRADGLAVVVEAMALVERTGMRSSEAELQRFQGEILLRQAAGRVSPQDGLVSASTPAGAEAATVSAAETSFLRALDVARRQQAKSWGLRAATSLARLRQQQGKPGEAYELLAPVYSWFTEDFDTADLQEAKALLEELV
jgi:hypothetical protein